MPSSVFGGVGAGGGHVRKKMGVVSLALITYFNVSGGPWGSEPIVAACGPLFGIIAALIFPFIWSLPLALSFAEMFSAFPTDSSYCTWVGKAFGRPMGFYIGYWSWVYGVIDNAIFPCLMVDSVYAALVGPEATLKSVVVPVWMYLVRVTVATLFMLPTIYSVDAVGRFLLLLGIATIIPFVVLVIVAIPQIDVHNWFVVRPDPHFSQMLSVLYWCNSGFDAAGAYAGEIANPRYTFPRAMMLTVGLVSMTYSVPFLAASGVDKPHYETWEDGFYPVIAASIWPKLRNWFVVCAIMGNMGVYVAKLTKNGFLLAGMADLGLAPTFFIGRDASTGVPRRSILLSYLIISFMAMFDFNVILGVDNFLSALSCVTELCAVVRLRFTMPELDRPYKVNLSDRNLLLIMILPFALGSFVVLNEFTKSHTSMLLNTGALACGLLFHHLLVRSRSNLFTPLPNKVIHTMLQHMNMPSTPLATATTATAGATGTSAANTSFNETRRIHTTSDDEQDEQDPLNGNVIDSEHHHHHSTGGSIVVPLVVTSPQRRHRSSVMQDDVRIQVSSPTEHPHVAELETSPLTTIATSPLTSSSDSHSSPHATKKSKKKK